MSSRRLENQKHRFDPLGDNPKKKERLELAILIENMGNKMKPCSFCVENCRKCVVYNAKSTRCSEYVRAKRRVDECDAEIEEEKTWESEIPRSSDWVSIDRQIEELDMEEERAAQTAMEAMAKASRLKKQRAFLKKCKEEMLGRGLRYLDELDSLEAREEEAAKALQPPAAASSANDLDFSDPLFLSWATQNLVGEASPGNGG